MARFFCLTGRASAHFLSIRHKKPVFPSWPRDFFCIYLYLNIKGMVKNHRLARSIADMGFFEFRRQLEYKAAMRGGQVVVADRFFASSKTCSVCGHMLESLPLSVRQWACPACAANHDRDVNAAINLKNMAVSSTVSACGEEGAGRARKSTTKPASVKQEVNSRFAQK